METMICYVRVGLHQESVLSQLLFTTVTEAVAKDVMEGLPWEIVVCRTADELVLMAKL